MTNDGGATILKSIALDNAVSPASSSTLARCRTTRWATARRPWPCYAAEPLRESEQLVSQKIDLQTIIEGWPDRADAAARSPRSTESAVDNSADEEGLPARPGRYRSAMTAEQQGSLAGQGSSLSLAVDAVLRMMRGSTDLRTSKSVKKAGAGSCPTATSTPASCSTSAYWRQPAAAHPQRQDLRRQHGHGHQTRSRSSARVCASTAPSGSPTSSAPERDKMRGNIDCIKALGINGLVNRQLVWPRRRRHRQHRARRLLTASSASPSSRVPRSPPPSTTLYSVALGHAAFVEEAMVGEVTA